MSLWVHGIIFRWFGEFASFVCFCLPLIGNAFPQFHSVMVMVVFGDDSDLDWKREPGTFGTLQRRFGYVFIGRMNQSSMAFGSCSGQ